ncbi:MAG: DUF1178 family protein [Orrella sp.]
MSLKVFNLQCADGHLFEGWFSSHEDYDEQQQRGLLTCPMCQNATIEKRPSAPRLNFGKGESLPSLSDSEAQALMLKKMREVVLASEDVGVQFAEEARRIHDGEAQERAIRGVATAQECAELAQDGIAVVAVPEFLNGEPLQ